MEDINDILKRHKRVARQARLEHEKQVGRPRASSWRGKTDTRKSRRDWRKESRRWG